MCPLAWAQEILRAKHLGVGGWVHLRLEKRAGIYLPVVGGAGDGIITRGQVEPCHLLGEIIHNDLTQDPGTSGALGERQEHPSFCSLFHS